jgi:hypothetical protein
MKHLKRFNESINEYYQKISQDDYCLGVYKTTPELATDSHWNTLGFDLNEKEEIQKRNVGYQMVFKKKHQKSKPSLEVYYRDRYIYIEKVEDEWFYVAFPSPDYYEAYYKCDQFDGLLEFLKYKGIIK